MPKAFAHPHDSTLFYRPDAHSSAASAPYVLSSPTTSTKSFDQLGSPSTIGRRTSPHRTNPLPRGEACLSCRRRKMKCDAGKPSCTSCVRAGKADSCEYEETRFLATIAALEEQIRELRARVRELEGSTLEVPTSGFTAFLPTPATSPTLRDADSFSPRAALSPPITQQYEPLAPAPAPAYDQLEQWSPRSPAELDVPLDLQPALVQQLLSIFIAHAHEFGLPAQSIPLLGRHAALTFAACSASSSISASSSSQTERAFRLLAESALAKSANHPDAGDVQATALLAQLAFARGRTMEDARHLGAARALAGGGMDGVQVDEETWAMVLRAERMAPVQTQPADAWVPRDAYGYEYGVQ